MIRSWEPLLSPIPTQVLTTSISFPGIQAGFLKRSYPEKDSRECNLIWKTFQENIIGEWGVGKKETTKGCGTKPSPSKENVGSVPQVSSRDAMGYTQVCR